MRCKPSKSVIKMQLGMGQQGTGRLQNPDCTCTIFSVQGRNLVLKTIDS